MRRETLSREKVEMEAILPVEKNADWSRVRKKSDIRASDNVNDRKEEDTNDAGIGLAPFAVPIAVPFV